MSEYTITLCDICEPGGRVRRLDRGYTYSNPTIAIQHEGWEEQEAGHVCKECVQIQKDKAARDAAEEEVHGASIEPPYAKPLLEEKLKDASEGVEASSLSCVSPALTLTELGLTPDQAKAFEPSVKSLLTHDSRTVFLSGSVTLDSPMDEATFKRAAQQILGSDLKLLAEKFQLVGHLAPPSYLQLVNGPAVKYLTETSALEFDAQKYQELGAGPPYSYAIFVFPQIARNYDQFGPFQSEEEFMAELGSAGIGIVAPGQIGKSHQLL